MATGTVLTDAGGRHAPSQNLDVNTIRGKVVVNQGAEDDAILQLKSSDVAHGVTTKAETDTYGLLQKSVGADGGVLLMGFSEGNSRAVQLSGIVTTEDATKSTAAVAAVHIEATVKSGTNDANPGANANMLVVRAGSNTRFIMDADGDSHQDVGTSWTNFDIFDDVEILNTLAAHVSRRDDPLRQNFRQWLEEPESRRVLEKYRLVTFNEDGHHFVNMSRLTMLLVGAVRQVGAALSHVTRRLDTLEYQLAPAQASGTLPR